MATFAPTISHTLAARAASGEFAPTTLGRPLFH